MLSASADADGGWSLPRVTSPQALRVVHVVPRLQGGAETEIRRLCERLLEHNINVTIVSVYPCGLDEEERSVLSVPLIELPQARGSVSRARLLSAELRRLRPDVAHFHFTEGRFTGRFAAQLAGQIPFVVFSDDGGELGGLFRKQGDKLLNASTSVFVVSTEEAGRRLIKTGIPEKKVAVIPSGGLELIQNQQTASKIRTELGVGENEIAMVLPARLAAQKNQRLAMRALSRVYGSREDWHLFLLGEGPDDNMLRREAARLHIAARVKFLAGRYELATLLPAMDVFLISSNWERIPTAMGDAMLAGIPVVSSPWDGYSEFLVDGETGFVASDWSQEAFAESIERVFRDPARAKRVTQRARIFAAERFDMDGAARRYAELYYGLMRGKRR